MSETQSGNSVSIHGSIRLFAGSPPVWSPQLGLEVRPLPHNSCRGAMSRPVILGVARLVDACALVGAGLAGFILSQDLGGAVRMSDWCVAAAFATVSAVVFLYSGESYRLDRLLGPLTDVGNCAAAITLGMAVHGSSLFILEHPHVLSAAVLESCTWGFTAGLALILARVTVSLRLTRHAKAGRLTRRIAIVGANEVSQAFIERSGHDSWTQVVGVYDDRPASRDPLVVGAPVRGTVQDLILSSRQNRLDAVVLALPATTAGAIGALRQRLRDVVADVAVVVGSADLPASHGAITVLAGNPVVVVSRAPLQGWDGVAKTAFDTWVSVWLLLAMAPLMVLIALLIKCDSRGPVLFRQEREGLNNTRFTILKFRTMTHDSAACDQSSQATRQDRRVTRFGGLLRRLSLDELPQLLNVLAGDMSLVGPRPHLPATRCGGRLFPDIVPGYAARHRIKPGITGLAQVRGLRGETRTELDIIERVKADLDYIERWSMRLDMHILAMTALKEIVSRSGNAY